VARSVIVKLKRLSVLWCECPSRVGSAAGAKARFKGNKEILDCNFLFWGGGGGETTAATRVVTLLPTRGSHSMLVRRLQGHTRGRLSERELHKRDYAAVHNGK